jgi:alkylation response protein AidB-like acyl-CoA dehydrogenase
MRIRPRCRWRPRPPRPSSAPAYFQAAADGVQLHGGLGYTWEHQAHLYYKRAKTSELLFGNAQQELARRLGL